MKLVSVNAVLISSCNISLLVNSYQQTEQLPTMFLVLLSLIFVLLLILLEYQHRQFKKSEINISQSSWLFKRYIYLFAVGLIVTLLQRFQLIQNHPNIHRYVFLSGSLYSSMVYFILNFILGNSYLYLFEQQYTKANRNRLVSDFATNTDNICTICYNSIQNGQKIAKIVCMHTFHIMCLNKWIKQKHQCPICKTHIQVHF